MKVKTIFISDVHLGSHACKAKPLCNFLEHYEAENYYLVGDILDGWKIWQNHFKWDKNQSEFVRVIFKLLKKSNIYYIVGNHDEFLRPILNQKIVIGGLELHNQMTYIGVNGKKYLVIHGDLFDGISTWSKFSKRIVYVGEYIYDFLLRLNGLVNRIRHWFGFGYWSLSHAVKTKVRKSVNYIFEFEENLTDYAKKKGFDGVICGHIHYAEIKTAHGVEYMNTGDWTESCTAIVEHFDGRFELVKWRKQ